MNTKNIFYERTEDEKEVRITFSPLPTIILYAAIAVFVLLTGLAKGHPENAALLINCAKGVLALLLLYSVVYFVITKKANDEVKDVMRKGNIKLEGGRLSFRSPFTCVIPKIKPEEERWTEEEDEPEDVEEETAAPAASEETEEQNG